MSGSLLRLGWYGVLLATLLAVAWMLSGPGPLKPNGEPVAPDFAIFYLAGQLAAQDGVAAAYDWNRLTAAYTHIFAVPVGGVSWNYPPPALLPFIGLAQLPYLVAVLLWSAGGLLALTGLWLPLWRSGRGTLLAFLLFPGTAFNLVAGQNGLWLAALIGGALLRLDPWPIPTAPVIPTVRPDFGRSGSITTADENLRTWLAGGLCGLVALKPSLLPLLPLALYAGRRGPGLMAMLLVLTGLGLAGTLALGSDSWRAFADTLQTLSRLEAAGAFPDYRMPTLFLALRRLGLDATPALFAQGGLAATAAWMVWHSWRYPARPGARTAVTAAAVPLVPPYLFEYDLVILFLPLSWLWQRHAASTPARLLLLGCGILLVLPPLVSRNLGGHPALLLLPLLCIWTYAARRPA